MHPFWTRKHSDKVVGHYGPTTWPPCRLWKPSNIPHETWQALDFVCALACSFNNLCFRCFFSCLYLFANDYSYENHGMKLSQALSGRHNKFPTILLAHQPWAAYQALKEHQDIDLILSGHTHGGQFFPMHIPIYFYNPFFSGLYKEKETFVYVSSGTYFFSVPLRIGSTSEITVLTLTPAKQ